MLIRQGGLGRWANKTGRSTKPAGLQGRGHTRQEASKAGGLQGRRHTRQEAYKAGGPTRQEA